MHDVIIGLAGAIVGGVLAIVGGAISADKQHKAELKRFWYEKQFDTYCTVVEFLYALAGFVGGTPTRFSEVESIGDAPTYEELWEHIVVLKRKIYPQIHILFDRVFVNRVEELYEDISHGRNDRRFNSTTDEIEDFIESVKKDCFRKMKLNV